MNDVHPNVLALAPDLKIGFPRSPRETLAGYIIAAHAVDKCRAQLAGTIGSYTFDGFMDNLLFSFAGLKAPELRDFVATGADDEAVAVWIQEHAIQRPRMEIVQWNNEWRYKRISEMPERFQQFWERYIPHVLTPTQISKVSYLFDVFDAEEGRLGL
jgi:hypothetical protein